MDWGAALAAADQVAAGFFDRDACTAVPMRRPELDVNAVAAADPAREAFMFQGTIEFDPSLRAVGPTEFPTSRSPGDRQAARICLSALASGWPWLPRQGDLIACAGRRYAVIAAPDRDGTDRIVLWLNAVAS